MRIVILSMMSVVCLFRTAGAAPPVGRLPEVVTNSVGIGFKLVKSGTLTLELGKGTRELKVTQPFYLGFTEVTNAQGMAVMGFVPSKRKDPGRPIESVSWYEAVAFCDRLSSLQTERIAGRVYRLPTSEEWEYACRAGSTTAFSFGDDESLLGQFASYVKNSGHPQMVAGKQPNPWGLFGMHGNVSEWCSTGDDKHKVVCGGQWNRKADQCRSGSKKAVTPQTKDWAIGFRLALTPPGLSSPKEADE